MGKVLTTEDLRNWFSPSHPEGGWKRINSKGEAIGPCAREPGEPKPKCMSNEKRAMLSKSKRASAVRVKRKHDPNPERKGEPIMVSNFGKGKINEKNEPTNKELWSKIQSLVSGKVASIEYNGKTVDGPNNGKGFRVHPSAYSNGWASAKYKELGGDWKTIKEGRYNLNAFIDRQELLSGLSSFNNVISRNGSVILEKYIVQGNLKNGVGASSIRSHAKKYGAKVKSTSFGKDDWIVRDEHGDILAEGFMDELGAQRYAADHPSATVKNESGLGNLHTFDITPQMREEVLTKGQPLYQQIGIPAATGAAGAGMLEDEPAFNRSEKVNITDNPDAMFLELNDQHFGVGGAAKKAIKALKGVQDVLPAAEREANLQKLLSESKTPMRLYHGTTATEGGKGTEAIRRIKPSKEGALGSGVYLTPKTAHASGYTGIPNDEAISLMQSSPYHKDIADQFMADRASGTLREGQAGGNMLPVYARIRNPLIIGQSDKGIDPAAEALVMLGMDESKAISLVERAYEEKGNIGKQIQSRAQAQGYDGLMQYRNGELSEVVSYNPSSVKSAIGNKGTYDTTQPDINEAQGGLATLKRK